MDTKSYTLPPRAPRYKSILRLQRFMKNPIPFMNENLKEYGETYCFSLRYSKVNILTIDPDLIQHILRKNVANYEKPDASTSALARFIGRGLLLATGEEHSKQRKLIAPGFRPKSLEKLIGFMDGEIDQYYDQMDKKLSGNPAIIIDDEMRKLTFNVMSKAIYGSAMTTERMLQFYDRFQTLQSFLSQIVRIPSLMRWYNINGKTKHYEQISKANNAALLELIDERRKSSREENLLGMLMDCVYEDTGEGMSNQQLLEESLILIVAGHETASNILSWIFYLLAQHPECISKIKAEADASLLTDTPTFDQLLRLDYLNQVIDECLRLYPPSWIYDRIAKEDDHFNGFDIPKGSRVIPFVYGLHHSERLWPNPEVFDPSRFTKAARKERHNFAHMPFGAGPRQCIGRNFAMLEMKLIIIKLLQRYEFEVVKDHKIALLPSVTLKPRFGVKLRMQSC